MVTVSTRDKSLPLLARRLRGAGARYATVFGSLSRREARSDSDLDLAISIGRPMSGRVRRRIIGLAAQALGRPVDLIDLETASGLVLARALRGTELVCDSAATRRRMIVRLLRSEDDRRTASIAARAARATLFS
jgi:predicted nucleotidyltransferase